MCCRVMSPPRRQGMNPFVKTLDLPKEPTGGQLYSQLSHIFSEDGRLDDGMLGQRHRRYSVLTEMGQGKLMGSIHCTRIPFILITINQSHLLPLSRPYSANPPVDPKTHISTYTVELFFVMILTTHICLQTYVLCLALFLVTIMPYCTFSSQS